MSTVAEIESAIERLLPEQVQELATWLETRKAKLFAMKREALSTAPQGGFPLFGLLEGKIKYNEGWDEPLEEFAPYTK